MIRIENKTPAPKHMNFQDVPVGKLFSCVGREEYVWVRTTNGAVNLLEDGKQRCISVTYDILKNVEAFQVVILRDNIIVSIYN